MRYALFLVLLSSCGMDIKVEPITVNHEINFDGIRKYCDEHCATTDPTNDLCSDNCYDSFIQLIMSGVLK